MPLERITLEGQLERVSFRNPDNHYTVARLRVEGSLGSVTVVGHMAEAGIGESLRITGCWGTHPRFGQQFKIETCEVLLPDTVDGIRRHLSSGIIAGVGNRLVRRIVDHFGEKTLEIIENEPEKLLEVPGIGEKVLDRIVLSWREHHVSRDLMRLLMAHDVPAAYGAKLLKVYGDEAVLVLTREPYRLAADLPRDGFFIADRIARSQGLRADHPERVRACIRHILNEAAADGHTYLHLEGALGLCEQLDGKFQIPANTAELLVKKLSADGELVLDDDPDDMAKTRAFLKPLNEAESGIAQKIKALATIPTYLEGVTPERLEREVYDTLSINLSLEQRETLFAVFRQPVGIITGGPGTGKTTLIRSVAAVYDGLGKRILLAAPTGRAAKRLSEVTGKPALTLHRMLGYNPSEERFEKNADDPLEADAVIVDEASMIDTALMYHLLMAVCLGTHLLLVGDVFQLPSVGPGTVLGDLIDSGKIATFELTEIFRQARRSPIVMNAHRVRRGEMPDLGPSAQDPEELSEFYFFERSSQESVVETVEALCTEKIPHAFGLDPMRDIQVLSPMHKGPAGTIHLNHVLQKALNPAPPEDAPRQGKFRVGDKVMHLKNNYDKEVFNGDIGMVEGIEPSRSRLHVRYDGRRVSYDYSELEELTLAYAISVHKSQGSEYPAVVVALVTAHFPLLQRNLLYTAMTRGKKLVILVGSRRAFTIALENDAPRLRRTGLRHRLESEK